MIPKSAATVLVQKIPFFSYLYDTFVSPQMFVLVFIEIKKLVRTKKTMCAAT
jgi:hypothetical protein